MKTRAVIVVLYVALAVSNYPMEGWYKTAFPGQVQASNKVQVLASVLGGLRAFVAKMLWFKADVYHHEIESHGVPSETDPNTMAMHRLSALLDPQFVPAWDVGSWDLFEMGKFDDALAFDQEGIQNNPDAEILWFDKALYLYHIKRYAEGQKAALKAFNLSTDPLDQVNCLRLVALTSARLKDYQTEINALMLWTNVWPNDPLPRTRLNALLRDIKQNKP